MTTNQRRCFVGAAVLILTFAAAPLRADWPTWRGNAGRTAATSDPLPETLQLRWQRELPRLTPAWEEDPRLHFDGGYEPIVAGGLMYVASSRNDALTAFDIESGAERWRIYAGGPIRFAPVFHAGVLYFGADDGCLYCVDASSGRQLWSFLAAPTHRKVLGNARMTSVWPVRGGPVLNDGRIWFTAGVWPFEGTFLYSFEAAGATAEPIREAASGAAVVSIRDSGLPGLTVETLSDITPQGYLVGTADRLYVPCGRSNVLTKDLRIEQLAVAKYTTGETSSYHVSATERLLFHGGVSVDMQTSGMLSLGALFPVVADQTVYFGKAGAVVADDLANPREVVSKDRRGRDAKSTQLDRLWELTDRSIHDVPAEPLYAEWIKQNPIRIDLKAGDRLYGHQGNQLFALLDSDRSQPPTVVWRHQIAGTPRSVIAAKNHLFVVTEDGNIVCFGANERSDQRFNETTEPLKEDTAWSARAAAILKQSPTRDGYCLAAGIGTGGLIKELARQSNLQIVAVDPDPAAVDALRTELDRAGLYGTRVSAIVGDVETAELPPYFASLVVSATAESGEAPFSDAATRALFHSTRPYGGRLVVAANAVNQQGLAQVVDETELTGAEVQLSGDSVQLTRQGPLPGSADWTHEYGDPSNTLMSHDELVKAPLGVLWFGGPASSGKLFYNRHFWGPSMAVIGGRMFIQGPGNLAAVDVYTGQILWQKPLTDTDNYRPGRAGNDFEDHLSGFHFLAVEDSLYLVLVDRCARIDPQTGATLAEFRLPNEQEQWGRIRVEGDLLITEVFGQTEALGSVAVAMAAIDRQTGELKWRRDAELSFPMSAVSGDSVYCVDGALEEFYKDWKRKGLVPKASEKKSIVAIDLQTGEERWRVATEQVVTWLAFSRAQNMLIGSNKHSISAFDGTDGYQVWTKLAEGEGFRGHPETLWDKVILWNDQILDQRGPGRSYDIRSGEPISRVHPITGESVAWEFTKSGHHCNYAIANPYLMTFRADTAGFCDIATGTTARLSGYRPGCRNSLIPANGVLNSPNFAHGCVCGYPLFTSLALVHRPDAELWTYSAIAMSEVKTPIKQLAINFGAPGDRQAENGVLWLGHPSQPDATPRVEIKVEGDTLRYFRDHSTLVDEELNSWVAASGVEGATAITIALNNTAPRTYSLKLVFREPDEQVGPSDRIFSVRVQGAERISDLDVLQESGSPTIGVWKEIGDVRATDQLRVELAPRQGLPVLCGLELTSEP